MKRKEIEDIFSSIKSTFLKSVENIFWLDGQTKRAVHDKVEKETALIGFPDEILNEEQLMNHYKGVRFFLRNLLLIELILAGYES